MFKNKSIKYELAPQLKLYDVMQANWRSFLMFNQESNLRSRICNTDAYGLRFNSSKNLKNKKTIFDQINKKKTGILLGNSMAFGEGASCDETTISSKLSRLSKINFLNFCGRGFSSIQEIINFILLSHKIKNIKKFVVISGLNDSILPFHTPSNHIDEYFTPIFGQKLFNIHMSKAAIGWKKKLLQFFLNFFLKDKVNVHAINKLNIFEQIALNKKKFLNKKKNPNKILEEIIKRNFYLLSLISKNLNVKINYLIQPVGSWCLKEKSLEEMKILEEENNIPSLKKLYSHVTRKKYLFVKKIIIRETKKYNMGYLDLNEFLNKKKFKKKWFFVSNFHVNDECNALIAKEIHSKFI